MPVSITRYNILLSSPGDAKPLVDIAKKTIEAINHDHSEYTGIELHTKHWGSDSSADSGAEPQALLNKQIVDGADIVLAVFKERFGTPTQNYGSGTEEEIRLGLKDGKRVMVYFWNPPAGHVPSTEAQPDKISAFRDSLGESALYKLFSDDAEFEKHINHDFTKLIYDLEGATERPLPSLSIAAAGPDGRLHDDGLEFMPNLAKATINAGIFDDDIKDAYKAVKASPIRKSKPLPAKSEEMPSESVTVTPKAVSSRLVSSAFDNVKAPADMGKLVLQGSSLAEMSRGLAKQGVSLCSASLGEPVKFDDRDARTVSEQLEQLGLVFEDDLLCLGELRRPSFDTNSLLGFSSKPQGTDAEKEKYKAAKRLVSLCKQRRDLKSFLAAFEGIYGVTFTLRNNGSAPAKHVRVELRVPSASLVMHGNAPQPSDYFIGHALEEEAWLSSFIDVLYKPQECPSFRNYEDSCVRSESGPRVGHVCTPQTLHMDPFSRRLPDRSDFSGALDWLYGDLKVVEDYARGEKVISLDFDRAQHNSVYGFPVRILMRSSLATSVRYRITADELRNPIEGELLMGQQGD